MVNIEYKSIEQKTKKYVDSGYQKIHSKEISLSLDFKINKFLKAIEGIQNYFQKSSISQRQMNNEIGKFSLRLIRNEILEAVPWEELMSIIN
jgi:3-phosphoglycerate kinase